MKSFICSLCRNGIIGGSLSLDKNALIFLTNKLTVDKKYRNLVMSLKDIKDISWKWIYATVNMKNGETYSFIIFNKSRFIKLFNEYKIEG